MSVSPFFGVGGRRAIQSEIQGRLRALLKATPVQGFTDMLDAGDAIPNTDRVSGFAEKWDRREWLLRLSSARGMLWQTDTVPAGQAESVVFLLSIGFGNGSPLPQPTGAWKIFINDRLALRIRNVNHTELWRGDDCAFAFAANRIESAAPFGSLQLSAVIKDESWAAFGPALLRVPAAWVAAGQRATIRIIPEACAPSMQWIQIEPCADEQRTDIWAAAELLAQDGVRRIGEHRLCFGDIHTHSGQVGDQCSNKGCGMGSRLENYAYARGPGALDFYALTDHEWQVDPAKGNEYLGLADLHNQDGRFACLPAFEFTNLLYGHRNVYFRGTGGRVFNANTTGGTPTLDPAKSHTPADLWRAMAQTGVPFLTVPHHPSSTSHPLNLDFYDPRYDRLYEVYSCWGSSEYYGDFPRGVSDRLRTGDYQDALRRGQRYGVIASSDGHDGHPGSAQSPLIKHHHTFHFCGSGRAAVLATELTRADVFDALYARRCYGTTGVPIVLDCNVCAAPIGSELPALSAGRVPQLTYVCTGTNGIDHVRIVKNGRIVHTIPCHGQRTIQGEWEDTHYAAGNAASYYVRIVQVDRESAWSSPVWIG